MQDVAISHGVTTAETWTHSRRLQAAAIAERERIERALTRLQLREAELSGQLAAVSAVRDSLREELDALMRFVQGRDTGPVAETPGGESRRLRVVEHEDLTPEITRHKLLKGALIRETAVRVLAAQADPGAPVHYRDWFELLTANGFMPAGKNPLATFLTQIGRSPVVQRSTSSGTYVLDLEFPIRARAQLGQLANELSSLEELPADAELEEIAQAREARSQLTTQIHDLERQLEEALRSLT